MLRALDNLVSSLAGRALPALVGNLVSSLTGRVLRALVDNLVSSLTGRVLCAPVGNLVWSLIMWRVSWALVDNLVSCSFYLIQSFLLYRSRLMCTFVLKHTWCGYLDIWYTWILERERENKNSLISLELKTIYVFYFVLLREPKLCHLCDLTQKRIDVPSSVLSSITDLCSYRVW